jgi:O-antigen/teichoic acid export membrane protein
MTFGMIAISHRFIPAFFGNEFEPASMIFAIMSVITIFISLSNVIGMQYLLPTKKEKYYTISVITGALINFILNYILIQKYQAIGAAVATVIAEFIVTAVQFYFVRKEFKFIEVLKLSTKYFMAGFVMFIVVSFLVNTNIFIRSVTVVLSSGIGALVYVGMLLLLKDEFLLNTIKSVKKMVFKKA